MNKQILRIAIAFPIVIASATSSWANDAVKPAVSNQLNIGNIQLIENQQQLFPSTETLQRPKPKGPKGDDPGAQSTSSPQILLQLETQIRPKPRGPGGHDPGLQIAPQQQLRY